MTKRRTTKNKKGPKRKSKLVECPRCNGFRHCTFIEYKANTCALCDGHGRVSKILAAAYTLQLAGQIHFVGEVDTMRRTIKE